MARPGIMIYFELLGPLQALSDAEKGRLLVAMLLYGKDGTLPTFEGMLAIAWEFVKPGLDRDEEAYNESILQRRYAAFCKKRGRLHLPKIPFAEWVEMSEEEQRQAVYEQQREERAVVPVASRYQTTTQTTTSTSTTKSTSTTTQTPTTTTSQRTAEADFEQFWNSYPEDRRGSKKLAVDAFRVEITSEEDADRAMENLRLWKQSAQWTKDNGQYVPYLDNWLSRGIWRTKPAKMVIPYGASGELGEAELEAIRRVLAENVD